MSKSHLFYIWLVGFYLSARLFFVWFLPILTLFVSTFFYSVYLCRFGYFGLLFYTVHSILLSARVYLFGSVQIFLFLLFIFYFFCTSTSYLSVSVWMFLLYCSFCYSISILFRCVHICLSFSLWAFLCCSSVLSFSLRRCCSLQYLRHSLTRLRYGFLKRSWCSSVHF